MLLLVSFKVIFCGYIRRRFCVGNLTDDRYVQNILFMYASSVFNSIHLWTFDAAKYITKPIKLLQ